MGDSLSRGEIYINDKEELYVVIAFSMHIETGEELVTYRQFGSADNQMWSSSVKVFLDEFKYFGSGAQTRWESFKPYGHPRAFRYEVSSMAGLKIVKEPKESIRCTSMGPAPNNLYIGMINRWVDGEREEVLFRSEPYFKTKKLACCNMRRLIKKLRKNYKEFFEER